MSTGWKNFEPSPIEYFHGRLQEQFHNFRKKFTNSTSIEINGNGFNSIIVAAKRETYEKYKAMGLKNPIPKKILDCYNSQEFRDMAVTQMQLMVNSCGIDDIENEKLFVDCLMEFARNKEWFDTETVTCECGNETPVETAQCTDNGQWVCPDCQEMFKEMHYRNMFLLKSMDAEFLMMKIEEFQEENGGDIDSYLLAEYLTSKIHKDDGE